VQLTRGAIATSGNYARYFQVGGRRYSHIIDPRNGQPADHIASATVVAAECGTADALATIFCVLSPTESLKLIRMFRDEGITADCLIVDRDGKQWSSPGWKQMLEPQTRPILAMEAGGWQNELVISLSIMSTGGRKVHRPIVATWIENADGKPVRTLSVWGNEAKYLKELSSWWSFARGNQNLVRTVTRASRAPAVRRFCWRWYRSPDYGCCSQSRGGVGSASALRYLGQDDRGGAAARPLRKRTLARTLPLAKHGTHVTIGDRTARLRKRRGHHK
jgi:hypothetical protein